MYLSYGWKWKILGIIGIFYTLTAVTSFMMTLVRRDHSAVAQTVQFSAISVGGVLFVGIFLFQVRDVYFFVWFLLIISSLIYLYMTAGNKVLKSILFAAIIFSGAVNLFYNTYPDVVKRGELESFYTSVADELTENGITEILVDLNTPPTAASISQDKITAVTYAYDGDGGDRKPAEAVALSAGGIVCEEHGPRAYAACFGRLFIQRLFVL
jgi:hypothetical protein